MEATQEVFDKSLSARSGDDTASAGAGSGSSVLVEPDLDFILALERQGGESLKKCFQCGTCSSTCALSPDRNPFPRKEMSWAEWGMKDRLLADPDVWLCHQCNDCSTRCPRGARPGDVLGAVRQQCVIHYAVPRFLGRWVSEPACIPLLLGIPAALLSLALAVREPIENALGIAPGASDDRIIFAYTSLFPHWLLNGFFIFFSLLALAAIVVSAGRFWRALTAAGTQGGSFAPAKSLAASIAAALKTIVLHEKFTTCTKPSTRYWAHMCVFFGFAALCLVTLWVITASINPLVADGFVYPFGFWNPWKLLANLGGAALLAGCSLMILDRMLNSEQAGAGSYFDWFLIVTLFAVVVSGFATEALHYVRLEPHRHLVYFAHLVLIFTLLIYLPYSKFAHVVYRTVAMVYAEYSGRTGRPQPAATVADGNPEKKE